MKESKIREEDLANLVREGNVMAFEIAFKQYREILFKHAFYVVRDMDEAEDVIQEVFTTLWEKRASIPIDAKLSSFLYRMTRNRVLNKLSHQKVMDNYIQHVLIEQSEQPSNSDLDLIGKELAAIIESEINKLPTRMREVFNLSRNEGLSHKEIAELLQISEGTSKLQVSKALAILRQRVLKAVIILLAG